MDNKTKLRIGGLALLTTAVLSLIIVLIVDSWPLAILLAVIIVAAAAGGFVWASRRQQRQFLERLKNSTSIRKKAVSTKPTCAVCTTVAANIKKTRLPWFACRKNVPLTKRTQSLKNVRPVRK